jgi:hypothetical protein
MPVQSKSKTDLFEKEDQAKISFIYQIVAFFADFCLLTISSVTSSKPCDTIFKNMRTRYFYRDVALHDRENILPERRSSQPE